MGSFYSTCSISNMTLSSQKTSILILVPSYNPTFNGHSSMVVSNDSAQAFFSPFGFPIHGYYDDYGQITNITRDKNVEMLEEYFGIDINLILKNIGSERNIPKNIKNKELYQNLAITYFRTEVLEYLETGWDKYNLDKPRQYSIDSFVKLTLDSLDSFVKISPDKLVELVKKKSDGTITDEEKELYFYYIMSSTKRDSTYISSLTRTNMFFELPITIDFKEHILRQYTMLRKIGFELRKTLQPSNYGSQDNNWVELYKFNDFVNDLLAEDIKSCNENWGNEYSDSEKEVVNYHKSVKRDKKINNILNS